MYKRTLICFLLCITLFLVSIARVAVVATDSRTVSSFKNGVRLTFSNSRGTIYDCNRIRLTNCEERIIAAISPTPRAITAISQVLEGDTLKNALERLKSGKPILCELPREINCDGVVCQKVYSDKFTPSRHIIGYTDKDSKGVSGLEKAFDDILYCEEDISVFYETDAKGRVLEGIPPKISNPNFPYKNGIVTTLDINIQAIAEEYSQNIERGAIVIADAESSKIKALVSRPTFDKNNVELFLESENSPLFNRAISAFNVGSVFKPLVASVGIEKGNSSFLYTCTGSCEIIDRFFKCHKRNGHGMLNLQSALAMSCNTYFYNFAFYLSSEEIFNTAKRLSFGQSLKLCDGITTAKGNLPTKDSLNNIAYLANFSIGQGDLLLSPVSILPLYTAIATNGCYYLPSLLEGKIINGNFEENKIGSKTEVFSSVTAETLRKYLDGVLLDGTGEKAKPQTVTAAGKTATAQTGKFDGETEICSTWFCGFFPVENPKYVVVVFSEDDRKQSLSCGEIFAKIADSITALK